MPGKDEVMLTFFYNLPDHFLAVRRWQMYMRHEPEPHVLLFKVSQIQLHPLVYSETFLCVSVYRFYQHS